MRNPVVCTSINTFPVTRARALVGVLEDLQPSEDGLLKIRMSGMDRYVDDSLQDTLQPLAGQMVAIVHSSGPQGRWAAGVVQPLPSPSQENAALGAIV